MNNLIKSTFSKIEINKIARLLKKNKSRIIFILLVLIPAIIAYHQYFIEPPPATKEDMEDFLNKIDERFPGYNVELICDNFKPPIIENDALFVDNCILISDSLTLESDSVSVVTLFRSDWRKSKSEIHYIFSIYSDYSEISVFEEKNTIKMKLASDGIEYILILPIDDLNWKDEWYSDEWNQIHIAFSEKDNEIILVVNDVIKSTFADINVDFSNATFFLGTSKDKKYFAEGWFNEINVIDPPVSKGTVTRNVIDAESTGDPGDVWNQVKFNGSVPAGTNVAIYINTSNDNTTWSGWKLINSDYTIWSGWKLDKSFAEPGIIYDIPSSYQRRYGQWRLLLQTYNSSLTPSIHNVSFGTGSK